MPWVPQSLLVRADEVIQLCYRSLADVLRRKTEDKRLDDWVGVLLDLVILAEGGQLDDPTTFVKRV
jgi:HSP90 family molecular chaperone